MSLTTDPPPVSIIERAPPKPAPVDLILLVIAVLAVSSSASLARWAEAPALALAFWRTLGGAVLLSPAAVRSGRLLGRESLPLLIVAGLALAVHFGSFLASLERTSVAASVTLVTTVPIFVAVWEWSRGRTPNRRTWFAIGLAFIGVVVVSGGDAIADPGNLGGDFLAIVGAMAMAVYLTVGNRLRVGLSTAGYAAPTYAIAAAGLLVIALASGTQLTGFTTTTWVAIGLMTLGPQLAGHTVLNLLLARMGSVTVSLALAVEPIGASALAFVFLDEVPPLGAMVGAPLVLGGLVLQLGARRPRGTRQSISRWPRSRT